MNHVVSARAIVQPFTSACCRHGAARSGAKYRVSLPAPGASLRLVDGTWPGVRTTTSRGEWPASQGRYAVHELPRKSRVRAYDGKGRELKPTRPNPYQWNVTGHDGTVRIVYKVFGNHVDGTYLAVDDSHAHMNMPATLMWARGFDLRPVRVTFDPPAKYQWKAATQLSPTAEPWTFTARNLQYLMDSPTELSAFTLRSFTVKNPDGKEYTIRTAVHHDGDPAVIDDYAADTEKIVNEAAGVFGEFPAFDTGRTHFSATTSRGRSRRHGIATARGRRRRRSRIRRRCAVRSAPSPTSSSIAGTSNAFVRRRSSRSTSKRRIYPGSCGSPKGSRSTTDRSSWSGRASWLAIPRASCAIASP